MSRVDPVSPELAQYVLRRDGWCVVGLLDFDLKLGGRYGPCRDLYGRERLPESTPRWPFCGGDYLTVAHVRDRAGGRMAKRPPSIPRRLVAACHGHHLIDPVVDRRDVREMIEAYLERLEGKDPEPERPWERIRRVRAVATGYDGRPDDQGGKA